MMIVITILCLFKRFAEKSELQGRNKNSLLYIY